MSEYEKLYWYWLSKQEEVGVKSIGLLLGVFGGIEGIFYADKKKIIQLDFLSKKAILQLVEERSLEKIQEEYESIVARGIQFVIKGEEQYPKKLSEIYEAPWFLYYRGELPDSNKPTIAIIGARNCSVYGSEVAKSFAQSLSSMGVQIISGLARGIDSFAHIGALKGGEKTFGIIGNGVDLCYPRENLTLYQKLEKSGGIISEYPLGSKALPFHFPMRNRIISGLSDGILVIEARAKSGTLITVDRGLEQGKEIFALPGRVVDDLSIGCNRLIQNGAKLVLNTEDILEELRLNSPEGEPQYDREQVGGSILKKSKEIKAMTTFELTKEECEIYHYLSQEPKHLDTLIEESGKTISSVMEHLCILELKGAILQVSNHYYVARLLGL